MVFVMISEMPTMPPKVQFLLNTTTSRIVVMVATTLQDIALTKLLTGFSNIEASRL